MAKKYYVVWKGRTPGIFTTWNECKSQVDGFAGARYKSFPTLGEAESAFGGKTSSASGSSATKPSSAGKATKVKVPPLSQQQITDMPFDIKIFTDGGCEPNPGEAGTGLAVYLNNDLTELWYGLYQPMGTNNTAELQGLKQAFIIAKEKLQAGLSVAIYSDSKYSIDCITKWATGWEKKVGRSRVVKSKTSISLSQLMRCTKSSLLKSLSTMLTVTLVLKVMNLQIECLSLRLLLKNKT